MHDNSFFTHLATGRLILERGAIPTSDPYTYTAFGEPWTVQSWLASVAYATAERLGGVNGVRVVVLLTFLIAGTLLWQLTTPAASLLIRISVVALALVIASATWAERPYMVGIVGLSVVLLALEGAVRPWILLPVLWFWANSHGSYPLAWALAVATVVGTMLDEKGRSADADRQRRVLLMVVLGSLSGVLSPLGLDVLLFPLVSLANAEALSTMLEWQAPDFTSVGDRAFLLLAIGALAAIVRLGRWRYALPVIVFFAAALVARRNIVMALPMLTAVVAQGAPAVGQLRAQSRPRGATALLTAAIGLLAVTVWAGLSSEGIRLRGYPAAALSFVNDSFPDRRVASHDFVGNVLEVLDGPRASVFIDDRADMFPVPAIRDYRRLVDGAAGWEAVLDDHDVEVVIWARDEPLGSLLAVDPSWSVRYSDSRWMVASRRLPAVRR